MNDIPPVIDIILDGKKYAMRTSWRLIPRVGDTLLLRNGEIWSIITRVAWGDDSEAAAAGIERQWVQIVCKTTEPS